jgi:hypothetical protein
MPRGIDAKCYRNTGTYASPTWTEITKLRDFQVNYGVGDQEIGTREDGVETFGHTRPKYDITGSYREPAPGVTDAVYTALADAHAAATPIELLILDNGGSPTTNGSVGHRGFFGVFGWSINQSLDEHEFREFSLKPTPSTTAGEKTLRRVKVTGEALTYADINSSTYA